MVGVFLFFTPGPPESPPRLEADGEHPTPPASVSQPTPSSEPALGLDSSGSPATPHPDDLAAFAEIKTEIDANCTILVAWKHWAVALHGAPTLAPVAVATDESQFGGDYFVFGTSGPDPWGNDEEWETNLDRRRGRGGGRARRGGGRGTREASGGIIGAGTPGTGADL
ncbi:MAG: hypothetical protein JRG90_19710, partial [Deltaproteobacteria bacterium]|nr:hypothetical protein [Deltaproteobacteria bacterium]